MKQRICSRERPPKDDLLVEWLSREIHYKCNEAEDHTGGAVDIDRSIQSQEEDLMHTTVCKGDCRQDSRHL